MCFLAKELENVGDLSVEVVQQILIEINKISGEDHTDLIAKLFKGIFFSFILIPFFLQKNLKSYARKIFFYILKGILRKFFKLAKKIALKKDFKKLFFSFLLGNLYTLILSRKCE